MVLTKATGMANDLNELRHKLKVIEKPVDADKTHPYSQKKLLQAVNAKLAAERDIKKLEKCIPGRNKETQKPELNSHCIQACISRLDWKRNNNEYHHHAKLADRHQYSDAAVDELVKRITQQDDFISQSKRMLNNKK